MSILNKASRQGSGLGSTEIPDIVYFSLKIGEGLPAEGAWHQLQLLRIAEEARAAARARNE